MKEESRSTGDLFTDYPRVYAQIDLDAIRRNVENMKALIAPDTKMIAVIKTDGYGHGAAAIAGELESLPYICGFALATEGEAFALKKAGISGPLLVLGYAFPVHYERMIREKIRITVFRRDTLRELSGAVRALKEKGTERKAIVHIKVDTGMNRIGIKPDAEGLSFVEEAFGTEGIEVEGIFTHFARADEEDKTDAQGQIAAFSRFLEQIRERGFHIPLKQCSNSAGILELPKANMDAVRAGVTMYGLWPSREVRRDRIELTPALSLHSQIVYIKEIEAGEAVSYGGTFVAGEKMRIATIPVGYGDGYSRALSGRGDVLIRGRRAPILGRICMDQFMVDVTGIPQARESDPVTLIGRDGSQENTMEELVERSGRFNYEFACCIGKRVPRLFCRNGRIISVGEPEQDF